MYGQTWPNWRQAKPGTRVEHVSSGAQGTFVRWPATSPRRAPAYAVVDWDPRQPWHHGKPVRGRAVAYAFGLRPIDKIP